MFKNKYFLYGLGTGLIITAIVLQLANMSVRSDDQASDELEWHSIFLDHIDKITEAAEQHGYKLTAQHANHVIDDELSAVLPEEIEHTAGENGDADEDTDADEAQVNEEVILNITAGLGSVEVAHLLEQLHLIDDRKLFEEMVMEKGLSTRIQIGTYRFTTKPSLDEIIQIITK